jgi:hypothetical protein
MADSEPFAQDEAENIRRMSPGDRMTARDGGANAKASIEGSFWVALFALVAVIAVGILAGYALGASSSNREATAAEMDDQSSRIYVLEYDVKNICAQLMAREIIAACH